MAVFESLDGHRSPRASYYDCATIGCLLCPKGVKVEISHGSEIELRELVADMPVVREGRKTEHSNCGVNALNDVCRYDQDIEVIKELITTGQIPGVTMRAEEL
jgi:hypothetical protein